MGVGLKRASVGDWMESYEVDDRAAYLAMLERHIDRKIDAQDWQVEDDAYSKVSSYTTYGVFRDCLLYVTEGDFEEQLDEDENIEREALIGFRETLSPGSLKVPYAAHFLQTGDSDTIFIPLLFDTPFAYDDRYVASLPGAIAALEAFATGLGFYLSSESDLEFNNGEWLPVATAKNVARILHTFFVEKQGACVVLS